MLPIALSRIHLKEGLQHMRTLAVGRLETEHQENRAKSGDYRLTKRFPRKGKELCRPNSSSQTFIAPPPTEVSGGDSAWALPSDRSGNEDQRPSRCPTEVITLFHHFDKLRIVLNHPVSYYNVIL